MKCISFVGSSKVGKLIYENSSKHGKRVQIQGGAKNYMVVMPDANLKGSVANILGSAYGCAGQRCLAGSVLVAVGDVLNPLTEELVKQAKNMRVGYGLDESSQVGTVISKASVDRIKGMIEKGISEGAKLEIAGRDVSVKGYEKGHYIGATICQNVKKDRVIFYPFF